MTNETTEESARMRETYQQMNEARQARPDLIGKQDSRAGGEGRPSPVVVGRSGDGLGGTWAERESTRCRGRTAGQHTAHGDALVCVCVWSQGRGGEGRGGGVEWNRPRGARGTEGREREREERRGEEMAAEGEVRPVVRSKVGSKLWKCLRSKDGRTRVPDPLQVVTSSC